MTVFRVSLKPGPSRRSPLSRAKRALRPVCGHKLRPRWAADCDEEASTMTKAELLDAISKKNPEMTKKQVGEVVEAVFDTLGTAIKKNGRFAYAGFGTFEIRKRKARAGRNPQTGEAIKIKASKTVGFKPAKALKDRL